MTLLSPHLALVERSRFRRRLPYLSNRFVLLVYILFFSQAPLAVFHHEALVSGLKRVDLLVVEHLRLLQLCQNTVQSGQIAFHLLGRVLFFESTDSQIQHQIDARILDHVKLISQLTESVPPVPTAVGSEAPIQFKSVILRLEDRQRQRE